MVSPQILDQNGRPIARADAMPRAGRTSANIIDWVHQFAGFLSRPDNIKVETYQRMWETDETCAAGTEFLSLVATASIGEYTHENEIYQSFVRENFEVMRGNMACVVSEMLTAIWSGFSVTEIVLQPDGGKWWLKDLPTLHPRTVQFHVATEGESAGQLDTVYQWPLTSWQRTLLPDKVIHYAHGIGHFGSPWGMSRYKRIYKNWFLKDPSLLSWMKTLDRYGSPIAIGTLKNGNATVTDPDGTTMTALDYLQSVLESLQNGSILAITGDMEVKIEQALRAVAGDFPPAQDHLNKMIFRGLLIPTLVFDNTNVGSNALGQSHRDTLGWAIKRLRTEVVDVLIDQLVRRLLLWNFGEEKDFGTFAEAALDAEDLKLIVEAFAIAVDKGFMSPDLLEDLNLFRKKIGATELKEALSSQPSLPAPAAPSASVSQMTEDLLAGVRV